ncbi:MAG: glycosyltransferase family 4 protein [Planctomycetes bacterium]|nr:glycosyltransferase family 4 protein [Planctomycetota bacterium]MCL4730164.1 glycosyltransferase family 4 protein [Planctomycetota bacterium]
MKRLVVVTLRAVLGALGRLCALLVPPVRAPLVCVFATPDVGGAERVHAEIVRAVAQACPEVWFTETPRDGGLLPRYQAVAPVVMLGGRLRRRPGAYFQAGLQAGRIRRGGVRTVFGAFSHFFYDMLPHLNGVRCVDLLHNFGVNFEHYSLPHARRLAARVVITPLLRDELTALYRARGLDDLAGRVTVIANAVEVPDTPPAKPAGTLRVLYAGRATPEKRVHLVGRLAARLAAMGVDAAVTCLGDVRAAMPEADARHCRFAGLVTDPAVLAAEYAAAHVLVLTSEREGFPVAVMEAMARGAVPLCTRVGGLALLPPGAALLVEAMPEDAVVEAMAGHVSALSADRARLEAMSHAAWRHAREHFDLVRADAAWRGLLLEGRA